MKKILLVFVITSSLLLANEDKQPPIEEQGPGGKVIGCIVGGAIGGYSGGWGGARSGCFIGGYIGDNIEDYIKEKFDEKENVLNTKIKIVESEIEKRLDEITGVRYEQNVQKKYYEIF